ncbi:hypothetical protein GW17_00057010, partial [Ensete ventricosum]
CDARRGGHLQRNTRRSGNHPQQRPPTGTVHVGGHTDQVVARGSAASSQGLPPEGSSIRLRAEAAASGAQHHRMHDGSYRIRAEGEG